MTAGASVDVVMDIGQEEEEETKADRQVAAMHKVRSWTVFMMNRVRGSPATLG